MTATPDIATMHPQDLRSAWRGRPAAKLFSTAPGTRSCQIRKGAVVWSWRPNDTHPRVASTVHVYREGGQLFLHVSDHVPGKHDRVVSKRQRLHAWPELERAVGMLVDGGPLVPRIEPRQHRFEGLGEIVPGTEEPSPCKSCDGHPEAGPLPWDPACRTGGCPDCGGTGLDPNGDLPSAPGYQP